MGTLYINTSSFGGFMRIVLRVGAAGGSYGTGSAEVYAQTFIVVPHLTTMTVPVLAFHAPGAAATFAYCLAVNSALADSVVGRSLAVMEISPNSTTGISP